MGTSWLSEYPYIPARITKFAKRGGIKDVQELGQTFTTSLYNIISFVYLFKDERHQATFALKLIEILENGLGVGYLTSPIKSEPEYYMTSLKHYLTSVSKGGVRSLSYEERMYPYLLLSDDKEVAFHKLIAALVTFDRQTIENVISSLEQRIYWIGSEKNLKHLKTTLDLC